ncbi:tetratricopeptide repeat protein [Sporolactobacillus sp. STCC-11]|uniref:tetratricopeptide repeat protein n=1 Tax=Sporolactobacillus caesalpiniae TaxID=3230362 RepID=UPI00339338A9
METSSESPILTDLETEDASKFTISLQVPSELTSRRLRRHRVISIQLFQEPGTRPLRAAKQSERADFFNDEGELDFTMPLRQNKMVVAIPYSAMPQFNYGDLITARISLEDTVTGEVLSYETMSFMANQEGTLEFFSHQHMHDYLKTESSDETQLTKTAYWINQNPDNSKVLNMGIALLQKLAEKGHLEALKKLQDVYSDQRYIVADENEATKWQNCLDNKAAKNLGKELQSEKRSEVPSKITDESSLKKCEEIAANGSAEARYMLYVYSCTSEGASYHGADVFSYLKSAAEDGLEAAVRALAEAYEKKMIFISGEQAVEYSLILKKAAEKKLPLAEYLLFQISYNGTSLSQPVRGDKKEAYAWLLASAEHGGAEAAYDLWHYFEHGNEFLMEQESALKWLIYAADHGFAKAKTRLGDLYIEGKFLKKDDQKGLAYLGQAAEQMDWDAQIKQFESYYEGRYKDILFEKNRAKAFEFLKSFAASGNPRACDLIMNQYEHGNEMMMEHREALRYLVSAAESGDAPTMYRFANVLLDGIYVSADLDKAKHLIEAAAAQGYPEAQFALYYYYLSGYKTLKNERINKERAYQWLVKAARTLPSAQYEVWSLSKKDAAIDWSITGKDAIDYLFRSAAQKYSPALYKVGMAFGTGTDIEKNPERGLKLIEEAASLHHPEAIYELSQIRFSGMFGGQEVTKDEEDGLHLLFLAAELHYPRACQQVGEWYAKGLLPDESEIWVSRIVTVAIEAGLKVNEQLSPQLKQEVASSSSDQN